MISPVAEDVSHLYNPPPLELLQTHADVRARDRKRVRDLLRIQRIGGQIEERIGLGHGAVDPPAGSHLAPVKDELLHYRGKLHSSSPVISDITEITVACQEKAHRESGGLALRALKEFVICHLSFTICHLAGRLCRRKQ